MRFTGKKVDSSSLRTIVATVGRLRSEVTLVPDIRTNILQVHSDITFSQADIDALHAMIAHQGLKPAAPEGSITYHTRENRLDINLSGFTATDSAGEALPFFSV